jgi:hypothetical protein
MLEIPDNHKLCSDCNEYKTLDQYYLSHAGNPVKKCKTCYKKYHRDKVEHKFKENGGTNHYYKDPDRYTTQEQKDQVFMVMEALGWTYTDGVWLKKGVKEIINGNIVWPNITPIVKKERKVRQTNMGRKIKSGVWNNTEKIVKLFKLFLSEEVEFTLGADVTANKTIQTKAQFKDKNVALNLDITTKIDSDAVARSVAKKIVVLHKNYKDGKSG